jgi:hypothetical protein
MANHSLYEFGFPNNQSTNDEAIRAAFKRQGLTMAKIDRPDAIFTTYTYMLTTNGQTVAAR